MGFLDEMGLDQVDAASDDWSVPNGVYPAVIVESKIAEFGGVNKWQINYKIDEDDENAAGKQVSEFFDLSPDLPDTRKAWLKRRLLTLEIDDEAAASLEPEDIIGTEVVVTVKNKPSADGTRTYTNVTKVALASPLDDTDDMF